MPGGSMMWMVLGLMAAGFAIACPLTALLVRLGHRARLLDSAGAAGHAKAALRNVPNIVGIGIFWAIALPMLVGLGIARWSEPLTLRDIIPGMSDTLVERVRESTPTALALLGCLAALHVMGVIDDRRGLRPGPKFIVQFAAAAVMVVPESFDVRLLTAVGRWLELGPTGSHVVSIAITMLWIVGITNAINFMDNMDGLCGGVSAIASSLFMIAAMLIAQWFIAGTLALLIGALLGFLVFNLPPARIFMGDGGSLVVGFVLAILTARTTYVDPAQADYALGGGWYGVFMPVIVLAIPLYDFVSVSLLRLRQGKSPLVGDQQHFSHRLVQRGLSKRGAVMVIWGATAVTGIGGIALGSLQPWQAALVGVQTILVLAMIAGFEHASRRAATSARPT